MKKYKVTLMEEERSELKEITSRGAHRSQKVLNALILLNCDEGEFQENRLPIRHPEADLWMGEKAGE